MQTPQLLLVLPLSTGKSEAHPSPVGHVPATSLNSVGQVVDLQ